MEQAQGHAIGIAVPTSSSAHSDHDLDHDEDHPDLSPVGSPDLADTEIPPPSDRDQSSALSEDLLCKIIKQVEYYFSDEHLSTDKVLMNYVANNAKGFVPIGVIASLKRIKKLTRDPTLIVSALKESTLLIVSYNGKMVKRLHPLPLSDVKDPMLCTVLVDNLPDDHSVENLRRVFGEAGNVKNITVREPHDVKDTKKCTVAEKLVSGKLHALVEYDTVEAAEKAVATLNNEQDWRYGLRVKLLKKLTKPQKKNVRRDPDPEPHNVQTSEQPEHEENHGTTEQHDDSHEEDVDHLPKEKNEVQSLKDKNVHKVRNRGRGRRQKYYGANGHGQSTSQMSNHGIEQSKPPPGPKMPDGTRGFNLGRGQPLAAN